MRDLCPNRSIEFLCGLFDKTRQAWHKRQRAIYSQGVEEQIILEGVRKIRSRMPRLGARKLVKKLSEEGFVVGRDELLNILRANGMLVKKRRNATRTTHSSHWLRKYPNLIRDLGPWAPNQLWVSDITYVDTIEGFLYLFLVTDAYSKKIVGYAISDNLQAVHALAALSMALKKLPADCKGLIHHSDRGVQYCSEQYVNLLTSRAIRISMTENGDPLENAIAERVNGILKDEWLYEWDKMSPEKTVQVIHRIIHIYNHERPHLSLDLLTPSAAHQTQGTLKRRWKNYFNVDQMPQE
jgi:transposase InsO family protein